jgi:hypothetical protein
MVKFLESDGRTASIEVSELELVWILNCIGVTKYTLSPAEMHPRLGADPSELEKLHEQLCDVLDRRLTFAKSGPDDEALVDVVILGRARGRLSLPVQATAEQALASARESESIGHHLSGISVTKLRYRPGKVLMVWGT